MDLSMFTKVVFKKDEVVLLLEYNTYDFFQEHSILFLTKENEKKWFDIQKDQFECFFREANTPTTNDDKQ